METARGSHVTGNAVRSNPYVAPNSRCIVGSCATLSQIKGYGWRRER